MKTFDKYKLNLRQIGNDIYSYDTHVATVHYDNDYKKNALVQHGWWSVTTQKHVNYVANEYNLPIIEMNKGKYETDHLNIGI